MPLVLPMEGEELVVAVWEGVVGGGGLLLATGWQPDSQARLPRSNESGDSSGGGVFPPCDPDRRSRKRGGGPI